nr:histidine kinase [Microbacterium testaceum]
MLIASFVLTEGGGLATLAWAAAGLSVLWAAHARRTRGADARALQIERAQEAAVETSRNDERGRIAQEPHDVAGQHLAGLVSLCDASIELAPAHPARALTVPAGGNCA